MVIFSARLIEIDAAQARLQNQKEFLRQHAHPLRSDWGSITDHGRRTNARPRWLSCWVRDVQLMCETFVKADSVRLPVAGLPGSQSVRARVRGGAGDERACHAEFELVVTESAATVRPKT